MQSIRPLYEEHGAEGYYRTFGTSYENPHLPEITELLTRNFPRLDCSGDVLDFAAGGGEVTQVLRHLGATSMVGCDPFTYALFEKNTGLPCQRFSFKDVVKHGLPDQYTTIISSFALHLCPPKDLFLLAWQLLQAAPLLVVITPHKRPELENYPGIELAWQDAVNTARGKRVRMKAYQIEL